jgi:two-component system KDP operon response regulator KdpE
MVANKNILVVDDEASIRKFLRISLEAQQIQVTEAATAEEGLQLLANGKIDLVILDLGLGDMDGQEVILKIREWSSVPIVVLTVQDSEEEKVQALDSGADDYLTKPFGVPELMARIRVALRHSQGPQTEAEFHSGDFEMDFTGHIVKVAEQEVKLTATEYSLLAVLVKNAGKVVTHRMLLKEVWGPNAVEHTQYLRVHLGQIRKKLQISENTPEYIVTESGVGYRFLKS